MQPRRNMPDVRIDVQQIIDRVLSDPRVRASTAFTGRTFADEPILRRGSQMAGYLPPRCRQMRELALSPEARHKPDAWVFYQQAKLMEDYEDDAPFRGTFEHYFPTYQDMSDRQLRGYFTWRAAVRRGAVRKTQLSFVFVYLYELLCGIGVAPGPEGFRAIERFWWEYREFEPRMDRYVRRWLRDYAVWHDLDHALIEPYVNLEFDRALIALRDGLDSWCGGGSEPRFSTPATLLVSPDARGAGMAAMPSAESGSAGAPTSGKAPSRSRAPKPDGTPRACEESLFEALDQLSSYRPRVSRLHRDRPETFRHVCCATLAQLAHHYAAHRKAGLLESLFGSPLAMPYEMFSSAVFWSEEPHPDAVYELDDIDRYTCARGRWYWEGYHGTHDRSAELGRVLRIVDQRLRDAIGYEHPLAPKPAPKYLAKIVDREIEARLAWEREQEARTIHVDLSQLAGIRAAASVTREALLVDEEREDSPARTLDAENAVNPGASVATGVGAAAGTGDVAGAGMTDEVGTAASADTIPGARTGVASGSGTAASANDIQRVEAIRDSQRRFRSYEGPNVPITPEISSRIAASKPQAASTSEPAERTTGRDAMRSADAAAASVSAPAAIGPSLAPAAAGPAPVPATGPSLAPAATASNPNGTPSAPFGLTAPELGLVNALVDGTPYEPPAGTSLDMLVDSVNEKLFDLLGDTALEFDLSGSPSIIEDYLEDVRGAMRP